MKLLKALVAAVVILPAGLLASETQNQPSFQQLDMNNDGFVSVIEATGHTQLLMQWVDIDTDSDGKLEAAEFSAFEIDPGFVPPEDNEEFIGAAPHK